jgi:DNA-binding transcriptional LysR family regulator
MARRKAEGGGVLPLKPEGGKPPPLRDVVDHHMDLVLFFRALVCVIPEAATQARAAELLTERGVPCDAPTVSRRLRALEDLVRPAGKTEDEWRLAERRPGRGTRLVLTEHGGTLDRKFAALLADHDRLLSPDAGRTIISVGATNTVTTFFLPRFLGGEEGFLAQNPAVDLRVRPGEWWDLHTMLQDKEIKLCICGMATMRDCLSVPLLDVHPCFIYHQNSALAGRVKGAGRDVQWGDLSGETVLLIDEAVQRDLPASVSLREQKVTVGRHVYLNLKTQLLEWVAQDAGVSVVYLPLAPEFFVDGHPLGLPLNVKWSRVTGLPEQTLYLYVAGTDTKLYPRFSQEVCNLIFAIKQGRSAKYQRYELK